MAREDRISLTYPCGSRNRHIICSLSKIPGILFYFFKTRDAYGHIFHTIFHFLHSSRIKLTTVNTVVNVVDA